MNDEHGVDSRFTGQQDYHSAKEHQGFRNGITAYRRPRGFRGRGKSNPYSRSNMIYAKKRRKWPIVLAVLVVVVAICAVTFFALQGN